MTPAAYYDWWFYSGICPGIPTRPANYALLGEKLSSAGVAVIILHELLTVNADTEEHFYITETGIYGCRERIGEAARQVGAVQLADYMPVFPDTTIVPESHGELKKLLKKFAKDHHAELAADISHHGDPRTRSDFDKRRARKEREARFAENNRRYFISDSLPFYAEPLRKLRDALERGLTAAELALSEQSVDEFILRMRYDFARWAAEPQPAEVEAFLNECRQLCERYPGQLTVSWPASVAPAPPSPPEMSVSASADILRQLQAIGTFRATRMGPTTIIEWERVAPLDNELGPVGLRFTYEGEFPTALLITWAGVPARFTASLPILRRELLASARAQSRSINDEAFLDQINGGILELAADPTGACSVRCSWDVEWDPEHGCEFEIDERGRVCAMT